MRSAWALGATETGVVDRAEVRRLVDEILRDPAYGRDKSWLEGLWEAFREWFGELFKGMNPEGGADWVAVMYQVALVAIGVCIVVGVWLLARRIVKLDRVGARAPASGRALALKRAEELRLEARSARERGDLLLALRLTFFALVVGLGENGDLVYRPGWTNRELFDRGDPRPEVASTLGPLVAELDARSFGGVPVLASDVDRFEAMCRRWLDLGLARGTDGGTR